MTRASRLPAQHDRKVTQGCVCGFLTDPQKECICTPLQIQRYRSKVSGPLLDRIDIQVEVPGLRYQELASTDAGENSDVIRQRDAQQKESGMMANLRKPD